MYKVYFLKYQKGYYLCFTRSYFLKFKSLCLYEKELSSVLYLKKDRFGQSIRLPKSTTSKFRTALIEKLVHHGIHN